MVHRLIAVAIMASPVVDLSAVLPLDAGRLCRLPPAAAGLFGALERADGNGRSRLPGLGIGRVTMERGVPRPGTEESTWTFRPAAASTWYGLPIAFVSSRRVDVAEAEGMIERSVGLAVPPTRLHALLAGMGHPTASAPASTVVDAEPFEGEASVLVRDGAAVLSCRRAF